MQATISPNAACRVSSTSSMVKPIGAACATAQRRFHPQLRRVAYAGYHRSPDAARHVSSTSGVVNSTGDGQSSCTAKAERWSISHMLQPARRHSDTHTFMQINPEYIRSLQPEAETSKMRHNPTLGLRAPAKPSRDRAAHMPKLSFLTNRYQ
ncbi:hypothetical protein AJ80_08816 [Polytolypa hystricis UAMH7299]|uniref:Uncharacterized protein n=1 Tax=Polytolypa hystricis (strain UAMH7299) TaxID=1447883 RepID=A0A2B7WTB0_POLH7|nr:hypothetical protein AJ80_08816 [Polytolypa hystricis UAMH7299]